MYFHQKQALNWMMKQENSQNLPPFLEMKGGQYFNMVLNYHYSSLTFQAIVTTMYPHQKQALSWMMKQENSQNLPPFWEMKGGQYFNTVLNYHYSSLTFQAIVTSMYPHQKQALSWMMKQENSQNLPPFWEMKGGQYFNRVLNYHYSS